MTKVILFDLYDTVLKEISFDFEAGIGYLYSTYFLKACARKDLEEYEAEFLPLYEKRKTDHTEVCLIKDEVPLLFERFGVRQPDTLSKLDYRMMKRMQKVTLLDEVRHTLSELHKNNIGMYILSNSIFMGDSAAELLKDFGIGHYFKRIYSSADYGIQKPSSTFFQVAIDGILGDYPDISKADILYVGNDYETDITGAVSVGLHTVWYNVSHLPNNQNLETEEMDDFKELLEIAGR